MKLIFVHGAGGSRERWQFQTDYFPESEAVSLPGHPEGKPCTSVEEYAGWLHGYIQQQGYKDVVLAGHSMGGAIVQLYALKYPQELKALILMGTGARLRVHPTYLNELKEAIEGNLAPWKQRLEEQHRLVDPEIAQRMIELQMSFGPEVNLSDMLCCDKFDLMEEVHKIKLPTLVICGSQDEMTPAKFAQYLASRIQGAKQVIIEGGTHAVNLEKPREFNRALAEFLESLGD